MNELDAALTEAMGRVMEQMRRDPREAARRARLAARAQGRTMSPWRLAIRANDTRIAWATHLSDADAAARGAPHGVLISSESVLELCGPVRIPWPGVDWRVAAARLGRSEGTIYHWIKAGVLRVDYCPARAAGKRGKPVAFVWTHRTLDPASAQGNPPDVIWGTLWQDVAQSIPDGYGCIVERAGRMEAPNGAFATSRFRGWQWICPGRVQEIPEGVRAAAFISDWTAARSAEAVELGEAAEGALPRSGRSIVVRGGKRYLHTACGRRCNVVHLPMPVWTIPDALGLWDELAELGIGRKRAQGWAPFACAHCWKLRRLTLTGAAGWREFVSLISGGVLCGSDVARSAPEAQARRKRPYVARPRAHGARYRQVLERMLAQQRTCDIAREMGVNYQLVYGHVRRIRERYGVRTNAELAAKLGRGGAALRDAG
ncbi:MAG: hypothetical protein ACF8R7_15170 [Phycisphaerales bacterium JB039]